MVTPAGLKAAASQRRPVNVSSDRARIKLIVI